MKKTNMKKKIFCVRSSLIMGTLIATFGIMFPEPLNYCFIITGGIIDIIALIFYCIFIRCTFCGKTIPIYMGVKHCPYCGEDINNM